MATPKQTEQTQALVPARTNPYALDTSLAPVDWAAIRERIDPQGKKVKARELVGQSLLIVAYQPFESTQNPGATCYYCRAIVEETGELVNFVAGGQAVVEVLDGFDRLRGTYREALDMGDDERSQELAAIGATAPIRVTMQWVPQGKNNGYYVFA